MRKIIALCGLVFLLASPALADDEFPAVVPSPPGATDEEISAVLTSELAGSLKKANVQAYSSDELTFWAKEAISAHGSLETTTGDVAEKYDIVLQPGHYPRTSGRTGGQGKYVNEQQYAAWMAQMIAGDLASRGVKVIVVPADGYTKGLNSKVFLSLHTDASSFRCQLGPSVGYQQVSDAKGMHGIALALAITMGIDPTKFMKDSYTKGLRQYYAFDDMNSSLFKGVLEMSELTCLSQEEQLLSRAKVLSANLAIAVVFALRPAQ